MNHTNIRTLPDTGHINLDAFAPPAFEVIIRRTQPGDQHRDLPKYGLDDIAIALTALADHSTENLYLLCLDGKARILGATLVARGTRTAVPVSMQRLIFSALAIPETRGVFIAHTHPESGARPSQADINTTNDIFTVLAACGIALLDHIILAADGTYLSMRANGNFQRSFVIPEVLALD